MSRDSQCGLGDLFMLYYFIRGIVIALLAYLVLSSFIRYPVISIVIIYGLAFPMPFTGFRHVIKVLAIVSLVTIMHAFHTIVLDFYNEFMEFAVVTITWSIILWVSIWERWVSRIGS